MTCHARQHSDQMLCGRCGLAWDVNDPEPPACKVPPAPRTDPKVRALVLAARRAEGYLSRSTPARAYEGSTLQQLREALKGFE